MFEQFLNEIEMDLYRWNEMHPDVMWIPAWIESSDQVQQEVAV